MKKTINKIICVFLSVLILIAYLPTMAFAENSGYYTYSLDEDGNAIITDVNTAISGDIIIPDTFDGHSVTSIGLSAFYLCTSLTSVTIPDSITSIEDFAFCGCTSLTIITIPESVTSIGNGTFNSCTSLASITIPDSVTSIGNGAFNICTSLTNISVDENNSDFISQNGILFNKIKTKIIRYPENKSEISYVIPNSITSIGLSAFYGCTALTSITIPDSVTSIGSDAFSNCFSLINITIPDSVTSIDDLVFRGCHSLTSITIPNGVTSIGISAFWYCKSLTNITIPDSVTSIGNGALSDCSNLSDVYYGGTEEQWNNIVIGDSNESLTSATIHFSDSQHEHTYGEWTVTTPATCTEKGVETRTCSVCGNTETREIPKIKMTEEIKDENTGIAVQYKDDSFDSEVKLSIEKKNDGKSYQIVSKEKENFKYELFDITITSNGEKVQPSGSVLVKMPVPEGYNIEKLAVYYVTNNGTLDKINSYYEEGYVYFEAAHFSDYVLVDESENQAHEYIMGDVNGDGKVNASDARLALRISAGLETATDIQFLAADVDESKKITASDARTILRVSAGLAKFEVK